jgi:hypothetical protein
MPMAIVFFRKSWAIKRPHCIVEINTLFGDIGAVLSLIPFKF